MLGHANIADDDVGAELPDQVQGFGGGGGEGDLGLAIGEDAADELAGVGLVIDHEHLEAGEGTVLADVFRRIALPWAGPFAAPAARGGRR